MPPEAAEVQQWLRKAEHDQRAARSAREETPPITDVAAFHCQQAVDKLFKAYLVWRGREFEKIHDLRALVNLCAADDPTFAALRDRVAPLTAFAVRFRYPGPTDPTPEQVEAALLIVEEARRFVQAKVPSDMHP